MKEALKGQDLLNVIEEVRNLVKGIYVSVSVVLFVRICIISLKLRRVLYFHTYIKMIPFKSNYRKTTLFLI